MSSFFFTLNEEKQKRIINGAMKEFAQKGYRNASTNEIVGNADISKGSLFHYFGSKKGLVEFLIQYSLDVFAEKIIKNMENLTADLIERWRDITLLKLGLVSEYPLIFEFMLRIVKEEDTEIEDYIKEAREEFVSRFNEKLYVGIDYTRFREDVDVEKAAKIIYWGLEGYAREIQGQTPECTIQEDLLNRSMEESSGYLDLLKKAFYKSPEVQP